MLGAVLPDVDSNNKGSYIYHKNQLFILAHVVSWLEYPISRFITKRKVEHRQSLHTIVGIAMTSLFVVLMVWLLGEFFGDSKISQLFLWFVFLFIGQLSHLICDIQKDWSPSLI